MAVQRVRDERGDDVVNIDSMSAVTKLVASGVGLWSAFLMLVVGSLVGIGAVVAWRRRTSIAVFSAGAYDGARNFVASRWYRR